MNDNGTKMFKVLEMDYERRDIKKKFGVDVPLTVRWDLVETLRASCLRGHNQTLERLNERGGLGIAEFHYHVHGLVRPLPLDQDMLKWFMEWAK